MMYDVCMMYSLIQKETLIGRRALNRRIVVAEKLGHHCFSHDLHISAYAANQRMFLFVDLEVVSKDFVLSTRKINKKNRCGLFEVVLLHNFDPFISCRNIRKKSSIRVKMYYTSLSKPPVYVPRFPTPP